MNNFFYYPAQACIRVFCFLLDKWKTAIAPTRYKRRWFNVTFSKYARQWINEEVDVRKRLIKRKVVLCTWFAAVGTWKRKPKREDNEWKSWAKEKKDVSWQMRKFYSAHYILQTNLSLVHLFQRNLQRINDILQKRFDTVLIPYIIPWIPIL